MSRSQLVMAMLRWGPERPGSGWQDLGILSGIELRGGGRKRNTALVSFPSCFSEEACVFREVKVKCRRPPVLALLSVIVTEVRG